MPAEAEATDILVRIFFEGAEYFLRLGGTMTTKGLSLICAVGKWTIESAVGHKKLGGKINSRQFINSFAASSIFPLSKEDFNIIRPELKRLHIPYMQYKSTNEMKESGIVEISVRKEDAERFIRCCESKGIASVEPYDLSVKELSPDEYEKALENTGTQGVNVNISKDGIIVNNVENPMQAPSDHLVQSEQSLNASQSSNLYDMIFNPKKPINDNLNEAILVSARRKGDLIPISANKKSLLVEQSDYGVTLTVPRTKKSERLIVPQEDISSLNSNGGKTIEVDLKPDKLYEITDNNGKLKRKMTGIEIRNSHKWNNPYARRKPKGKPPISPAQNKEGVK